MSAGPALIVFCREPVEGRVKTRLARRIGGRAAAALADAFIRDTALKAQAAASRQFVIAASASGNAAVNPYFRRIARRFGAVIIDQGAGSLGSRMARVLVSCGATTTGALLIGADVPTLPLRILRQLLAAVRRAPVVVAPGLDGGYYAIGVRGAMPPVFSGIRWGGSGVYRETVARLKRARIEYAAGPAWYDVDRAGDLALMCAHLRMLDRRGAPCPCPATARLLRRLGLLGG